MSYGLDCGPPCWFIKNSKVVLHSSRVSGKTKTAEILTGESSQTSYASFLPSDTACVRTPVYGPAYSEEHFHRQWDSHWAGSVKPKHLTLRQLYVPSPYSPTTEMCPEMLRRVGFLGCFNHGDKLTYQTTAIRNAQWKWSITTLLNRLQWKQHYLTVCTNPEQQSNRKMTWKWTGFPLHSHLCYYIKNFDLSPTMSMQCRHTVHCKSSEKPEPFHVWS